TAAAAVGIGATTAAAAGAVAGLTRSYVDDAALGARAPREAAGAALAAEAAAVVVALLPVHDERGVHVRGARRLEDERRVAADGDVHLGDVDRRELEDARALERGRLGRADLARRGVDRRVGRDRERRRASAHIELLAGRDLTGAAHVPVGGRG